MNRPLSHLHILEIESLGPAPFCGHLLADLGARITRITRPNGGFPLSDQPSLIDTDKKNIALDLKSEAGRTGLLDLIKTADGLIEGMRPGVMEKLGLGPDDVASVNPKLVYGRVTGWGQDGPLSQMAGHDINYAALSGALWYSGQAGQPPQATPTLIADVAGGALYLTIGMLSALMTVPLTGKGQVIDAAMVDGSAHMMNLYLSLLPLGQLFEQRGQSLLDGPHWYGSYECKDGAFITIGSMEPQFYAQLLTALGLQNNPDFQTQFDRKDWPRLRQEFTDIFKTKTQAEWCVIMQNTDICFAPVLSPMAAMNHPHMKARGVYMRDGNTLRAAPAPRFSPLSSNEA